VTTAYFNHRPWVKRSRRKPTKYERMRAELPYGIWRERDNSEVLFNRDYSPLWRRKSDGSVSRVDDPIGAGGKRWIHWVDQRWFFNDGNPPWRNRATRELCEAILRDWLGSAGGGGS
jgi:hypothetical protein